MAKWKIFLIWLAAIFYRLWTAFEFMGQNREKDLFFRDNQYFWIAYWFVWVMLLFYLEDEGLDGVFAALYSMAWCFLVAMMITGIQVLLWVLLRDVFGITVRYFWGEIFTIVFTTLSLIIPIKLNQSSRKLQEKI